MAGLSGAFSAIRSVMAAVPGRVGGKLNDVVPGMKGVSDTVGGYLRQIPVVGQSLGATAAGAGSAFFGLVALWAAYTYVLPMVM